MKKPFSLSASSIKTYVWGVSKWAWTYILWIRDSYDNKDALSIGKMFEEWLITGKDNRDIIKDIEIDNTEKFNEQYESLKHNARGLEFERWKTQVEVRGELFWFPYVWYVDNLTDEWIDDIKTAQYLSAKDGTKNMWSGMSYYEEYELQLWTYMKVLWRKKARILEVGKFAYKDKRSANQIIEFLWTDEWDKAMENKYKPIIDAMYALYNRFDIWLVSDIQKDIIE